jgi:hypothetical protein
MFLGEPVWGRGHGFCVNPCVWVGVLCVIETIEVLGLWNKRFVE